MAEDQSSHDRREQHRQQRDLENRAREEKEHRKKHWKKARSWSVCIIVVVLVGWFIVSLTGTKPYTDGQVHWHAKIEITVCGVKRDLPRIPEGLGHLGSGLLHTHDDNVAHIEGQVFKKESITLGKFMDAIKVPFSATQVFDKRNGDVCEGTGKPGILRMLVNGQPSTEFRDYVLQSTTDGENQVIELIFDGT